MAPLRKLIAAFCALAFFVAPSAQLLAATGSWNGVAFTGWNGIAQTAWNGTSISAASGGGGGGLVVANAWKGEANAVSTSVAVSPSAGSLLVVAVYGFQGGTTLHAVIDNIDTAVGWTKIAGSDTAAQGMLSLWYKKNIPSGITSLTVTSGTSSLNTIGICHEVTGASTTTPFTTGEFVSNTIAGSTTNPQTGSLTNATAASVFFAALCNSDGSSNPATLTINSTGTVGTWNLKSSTNSQETDANSFQAASVPNIIVSSGTAEVHGWTTASLASQKYIIAAFH